MSFWQILGGMIGVGTIAAAPLTGRGLLIGAATRPYSLVGADTIAIAAGAVGAVAGASMDDDEDICYEGRMSLIDATNNDSDE